MNKYVLIALGAMVMASCSNSSNNNKAKQQLEEVSVSQIVEDINSIPAPNSLELMDMINKSGAAYLLDATNSIENIENYLSTKSKALNLGVYAADLCYNVAYNKQAEVELYLKNLLVIVSDLNISINAEKISDSFKDNSSDFATLSKLTTDMLEESQYILNQTDQTEIALMFLIGSWVETASVCLSVVENSQNPAAAMDMVKNHFDYIDNIIKYLDLKKESSEFADFIESFASIKVKYEAFKADSSNADATAALTEEVANLRSSII
ncbi:MAG: hypothetical protein MJ069_03105 [Salinivirgaceae bacterium]|nr:hypothetical protein [Salinivirgaceae bacterium]